MQVIHLENVSKTYKINKSKKGVIGSLSSMFKPQYIQKEAVKGINFSINKGEMVGFIGPNGAGKSTTVKMLTGILVPSAGAITVNGLNPNKDRKKHSAGIGVVFGQRTQLWWDLPVIDTFDLLKHIYKIPTKTFNENMELFYEILGLKDFINQPVRQLSLGQRMRADIAAALIHNPDVVFFDEPTIGLDVVAKERIREFIKYMNREHNTTMLFTTHDMDDIEKTCKRMVIIDKGSIIYDGTVEAIKMKYGDERSLIVDFNEHYDNIAIQDVQTVDLTNKKKKFVFNRDRIQVSELISKLATTYNISDLTIQEPEIEGIIRGIYEGGIILDESLSGVR